MKWLIPVLTAIVLTFQNCGMPMKFNSQQMNLASEQSGSSELPNPQLPGEKAQECYNGESIIKGFLLCHVPQSASEHPITLCLPPEGVSAHLAEHTATNNPYGGDYLGACRPQ